ncbi:MAG TPA: hypothetical protein VIK01_04635 [Polyangiaceae bacterium]
MSAFYSRRTRQRQRMPDAEIRRRLDAGERVPVATPDEAAALMMRLGPGGYILVQLHARQCRHLVTGHCSADCRPDLAVEAMTATSLRQHAEQSADERRALLS